MHSIKSIKILATALLVPALLIGCTGLAAEQPQTAPPETETPAPQQPEPLPEGVNEAGRIPVLMYHRIAVSDSVYDRTPEAFRADLQKLYDAGYRPISLKDFVAGHIDVPAGISPFVLTFDDGDRSQYQAVETGPEPTPDCAMGIMEAFRDEHPDFNPQATFFVNGGTPFGQASKLEEKLNYLIKRGYTIGNHTWAHDKLSKLDEAAISESVGKNAARLEKLTGVPVNLLALPYGIRPKTPELMQAVISGSFEGAAYTNSGICNVGWQPELPAYLVGFDPYAINRVRCGDGEGEAGQWLTKLDAEPGLRYISDGDPDTVTVPADKADKVNSDALNGMALRVLQQEVK